MFSRGRRTSKVDISRRNGATSRSSFIRSKWFLIIIGCFFLLLLFSVLKEVSRTRKINKEIAQLQSEISDLEGSNSEFAEFVEYLKTDLYLEEQARVKLGLKADGEKVVVLQGDESNESNSNSDRIDTVSRSNTKNTTSNVSKWFKYFWSDELRSG